MAGKPGRPMFFTELAKPAKDLLQKGFSSGHTIAFSCLAPAGITISTTATMVESLMIGIISSSFEREGIKSELSISTLNQVTSNVTYQGLAPGLKASLTSTLLGSGSSSKAQVHYQHDFAALTATVQGFKGTPRFDCSANVGSQSLHAGGSLAYDTENNTLTGTSAGFGFFTKESSAALIVDPLSDKSVDAYCSQEINERALWGCHLSHKWDKNLSSFTFGGSFKLDPQTTVKAKMDNQGVVQALLQYSPTPLVSLGMLAQIDTKDLKTATPKLGLSLTVLAV